MTLRVLAGFCARLLFAASCVVLLVVDGAAATPTPTPSPTSTPLSCTSGVTNPGDVNNKLQNDYVTSASGFNGTSCITLTNGATLDLNGHSITNTGSGSPAAITCTAPGSEIKDTATAKGAIVGAFAYAVKDCEKVTGITIREDGQGGYFGEGMFTAVSNSASLPADSIINNVIDGAKYGIASQVKNASSTISNNYIFDCFGGIDGDATAGSPGPLYENNIIRDFSQFGIWVPTSDKVRVRRNLLIDRLDPYAVCIGTDDAVDPTNAGITVNACDCDQGCSLEPPYSFPFD